MKDKKYPKYFLLLNSGGFNIIYKAESFSSIFILMEEERIKVHQINILHLKRIWKGLRDQELFKEIPDCEAVLL